MEGRFLRGNNLILRALEETDLDLLVSYENDSTQWVLSNTLKPFSRDLLRDYLKHQAEDIYTAKQLRLVAQDLNNVPFGLLDFFDFCPKNRRVGIGLSIVLESFKNRGLGTEMLTLAVQMAFDLWDVHQVYANVLENNAPSLALFDKLGFTRVGVKKDWVFWKGVYINEILFQKIK